MKWRDRLETDLEDYIDDPAARAVIFALVGSVRTAERVLAGKDDDETRVGMAQLMLDFTIGLNSNPFWMRHSSYLMPVFATATSAWLDSFSYIEAKSGEDRAAFITTRNIMAEVAVAVLFCSDGAKGVRDNGAKVRKIMLRHGDLNAGGK